MVYPVVSITRSALLNSQTNGKLTSDILLSTSGRASGPIIRLITPAGRSWRAMAETAAKDGITLKATSDVDSYRPYDVQLNIFLSRYKTAYKANVDVKVWNGTKWYLWSGATAAVPGTSNHGWGQAVDVVRLTGVVDWLLAHAKTYGWSWEIQSESWHIHYFAGDKIPQAVLDYEAGSPAPSTGEDTMAFDLEEVQQIRESIRFMFKEDGTVKEVIGDAVRNVFTGGRAFPDGADSVDDVFFGTLDSVRIVDRYLKETVRPLIEGLPAKITAALPASSGSSGLTIEQIQGAVKSAIDSELGFLKPGQ